uniref:Uncharacterized protein n=1 Tax=Glossina pallidipes TaxID=7398 RepID=A0A1A9ZD47_GLOPL
MQGCMKKNEALSFNARQGLCFCSCVLEFIDEGRKGIKNFHDFLQMLQDKDVQQMGSQAETTQSEMHLLSIIQKSGASIQYRRMSLSSQSTDCSTNLSNSLESPELLLRLRRLRCKFHLRFN